MKNIFSSFSALVAGVLFGAGLVLSGMTNTHKVIGFLDIFAWDYDLAFVMIGAISVTVIAFLIRRYMKTPLFSGSFQIPNNTQIDKRLIVGAILFGIGWALYGLCPAPAVISLLYANTSAYLFFIAMLCGFYISQKF